MNNCCGHEQEKHAEHSSCHDKKSFDYLFWGSTAIIAIACITHLLMGENAEGAKLLHVFVSSVSEMMGEIWWGVLFGMTFVAFLSKVPREFVIFMMGRKRGLNGVFRATMAGVLLDLCSHGILFVAAQLYKKGASIGQVMAFLIASPWNSFSLTVILISLIGLKLTLMFIVFSMVIGIISGMIFEILVKAKVLPDNPNSISLPEDFKFFREAKKGIKKTSFNEDFFKSAAVATVSESRMILRWLFFGVVLASVIRTFMPMEIFQTYFGATMLGLAMTVIVATIIEVCSEGSVPIAADIINRAAAPGNGFAFLMTGVSTDYTEVMILKETTGSWKIALFLPLITVPQVIFISWLINSFAV